ncbi:MAG: Gfo/Idh/MocA family oxidoreductase [Nitrospinota bacterium]
MSANRLPGVSFIGLGWWGEVLAGAAQASGAVSIAGGYARTPATRAGFAAKYGCRDYGSLDELLDDSACEAVVIASANAVHKEQAVAAARAGKHVHLEKPMALSVSDAQEIVAACAEAGVKLSIGQNFRRWPMFRHAKKMIDAGELGTISLALGHFSNNLGLTAGAESMRWDPVENPGGPLYSYTLHLGDLMETLFGEVESVEASCGKVGGPSRTDDVAAGVLRFRSGMLGILSGSYMAPFHFRFGIEGTEGALHISSAGPPVFQKMGEQMNEAKELEGVPGFWDGRDGANAEQFTDLARCIKGEGEPEVTGVHGVRALAVMRAMLRSHAERRAVTMEEILESD